LEKETMLNHANEEIKGLVEATADEIKLMSEEEYESYCNHLDQAYQP
jgi:hypothetical protein